MSTTVEGTRRGITIPHPDKALFTNPTVSKLDLARYYEAVGSVMVPHLRGRPLALQVFPDGIEKQGFFMKSEPKYFPKWIKTANVPKKGGSLIQVLGDDPDTLVYLAGQNAVTPHIWLSRIDKPRQPDRLIIDLDPAEGVRFAAIRAAARAAGERLRDAGLVPHAMVTGSRGIHVTCPLRRGPSYGEVHAYARAVAEAMVADDPKRLTLEWKREDRGERIYLDINRINYAQHAVAPYGVRARPRAPVAVPIHWEELGDSKLKPDRWTIRTAAARIESEGDPWRDIGKCARRLPRVAS
jgi:bifunctional non-homologous end joining protein LigD